MQQLLIRGIGHTEYKYSEELSHEIPKDWKLTTLDALSDTGITNGVFKKRESFGKGTLLVNVLDLFDGTKVNFSKVDRVLVNEQEIRRFQVVSGDVLFCRSSLNVEGLGHCCLVDNPLRHQYLNVML